MEKVITEDKHATVPENTNHNIIVVNKIGNYERWSEYLKITYVNKEMFGELYEEFTKLKKMIVVQDKTIRILERRISEVAEESVSYTGLESYAKGYFDSKNAEKSIKKNEHATKPCPWCGDKNPYINNGSSIYPYIDNSGNPLQVTCNKCSCSSPTAGTKNGAWERWNTRI